MMSALTPEPDATTSVQIEYALCFSGRFRTEMENKGYLVQDLGAVRIRNPYSVLHARRRLRSLMAARRYDAVICQAAWSLAIFGPTVKRAGLPLVLWLHDPPVGSLHWLERWARLTTPDLLICNSKYTLDKSKMLFEEIPRQVLYCPVPPPLGRLDDAERCKVRTELGASPSTCVILQVGRLERHKGHLIHVDSLAQLPRDGSWMWWCVAGAQKPGDREYLQEIREAIEAKGLGNHVRFLDFQPSLDHLYASADLYCQPNTRPEPFGIAFVEAMYARLPLIGTEQGGTVEIITPEVGYLVPPRNSTALALALKTLVGNPRMRQSLGANGPERARTLCNPTRSIRQFEHIMGPLLKLSAA